MKRKCGRPCLYRRQGLLSTTFKCSHLLRSARRALNLSLIPAILQLPDCVPFNRSPGWFLQILCSCTGSSCSPVPPRSPFERRSSTDRRSERGLPCTSPRSASLLYFHSQDSWSRHFSLLVVIIALLGEHPILVWSSKVPISRTW